jgi:hypothetical protein
MNIPDSRSSGIPTSSESQLYEGGGVAMGGKSPQTRNNLSVNEMDIALCIASQQEQSGPFGRKFYEVNPSPSTTRLKDHCW